MAISTTVSTKCLCLRAPNQNEAELVMTSDGPRSRTIVYRLSFDQVRLLSIQFPEILSRWPVREVLSSEGLWREDDGA